MSRTDSLISIFVFIYKQTSPQVATGLIAEVATVSTLGTAACRTTSLAGSGAVLRMDATITRTSGLPGGQSVDTCSRKRIPYLSHTVTGHVGPVEQRREILDQRFVFFLKHKHTVLLNHICNEPVFSDSW